MRHPEVDPFCPDYIVLRVTCSGSVLKGNKAGRWQSQIPDETSCFRLSRKPVSGRRGFPVPTSQRLCEDLPKWPTASPFGTKIKFFVCLWRHRALIRHSASCFFFFLVWIVFLGVNLFLIKYGTYRSLFLASLPISQVWGLILHCKLL